MSPACTPHRESLKHYRWLLALWGNGHGWRALDLATFYIPFKRLFYIPFIRNIKNRQIFTVEWILQIRVFEYCRWAGDRELVGFSLTAGAQLMQFESNRQRVVYRYLWDPLIRLKAFRLCWDLRQIKGEIMDMGGPLLFFSYLFIELRHTCACIYHLRKLTVLDMPLAVLSITKKKKVTWK